MAKPVKLTGWRAHLADYPGYYDAHKDGLSDEWEHKEALNRTLKALREANEEMEEKEKLLTECKKVLQCHARQDSKSLRERISKALQCR